MPPLAEPELPSMFEELTAPGTMHTCIITKKNYIPKQKLLEIVTVPKVQAALRPRWSWLRFVLHDLPLENTLLQTRKLVAVLAMAGQLNRASLKILVANALTDDDLPLCAKGDVLQNCLESKTVRFPTWDKVTISVFLERQWAVLAPILDLKDGRPIDVELDENCALELSKCEDKSQQLGPLSDRFFFAEIASQEKGGEPRLVVVKKFHNAFKEYMHERDNLRKINAVHNNHLIKHLATCDAIPCIIFPRADNGDLNQFWEDEYSSDRGLSVFIWAIEQLSGLASALRDLHNMNCRHGDLKPSNIFYFEEDGSRVLKIADVGVSKIHSISTNLREGETATRASTKTYEAPEAYGQTHAPRSRTYDCWSMGCIILEFVIWLLYNQRALDGFRRSRDCEYNRYYRPKIPNPASDDQRIEWWERMERHPTVDEAIKLLREDARVTGTALEELVNLVDSKLLLIIPKRRLLALGIAEELQVLLDRCRKDQMPWVNNDEAPLAVPLIFSRGPPEAPATTY